MPRRSIAQSAKAHPRPRLPAHLEQLNLNAAAIDVGASSHFVAVPPGRDTTAVRAFAQGRLMCIREVWRKVPDRSMVVRVSRRLP